MLVRARTRWTETCCDYWRLRSAASPLCSHLQCSLTPTQATRTRQLSELRDTWTRALVVRTTKPSVPHQPLSAPATAGTLTRGRGEEGKITLPPNGVLLRDAACAWRVLPGDAARVVTACVVLGHLEVRRSMDAPIVC